MRTVPYRLPVCVPVRSSMPGLLLGLVCCFLLSACFSVRLPEGVIATVNGEPIHLRTVQALLDSRSGALGMQRRPTLANLKNLYGEGLGTLVVQALIRQELARRELGVTDAELETAVDTIRAEYGQEEFSAHLTELSLDEGLWRQLMRDLLAVQKFERDLLAPRVDVSLEEIRTFYLERQKDFLVPASSHVCFVTADAAESLTAYTEAFAQGAAGQFPGVDVQCSKITRGEIPSAWEKELARLKPFQCGRSRRDGEKWQNVCLKGRQAEHVLLLVDAFSLIERTLREEKMAGAFGDWLEQALASAEIKVSPQLMESMLTGDASDGQSASNAPKGTVSASSSGMPHSGIESVK